ncbi:transcriptional regulator NrdR [Litorivicinus sp.]|jgi:transcriptional repressor NrdR|nr:transcriptional regulator NrdR [Litorivicinus sp.]|tara:strand:- start:2625 stop:3077 length:453 start_codon:yes stop_codon:yes gene_type:complete
MRCPFCQALDTKVIDSRLHAEGSQIRRRRICSNCDQRFSTYETVELVMPRIAKSNGQRENFDEEKLRKGLIRALEKRPVTTVSIDACIQRIKRSLQSESDKEIESRRIGDHVMRELKALDQVAYVRFASVYRSFSDVTEFIGEIEKLTDD